jgi:hypothetical protein
VSTQDNRNPTVIQIRQPGPWPDDPQIPDLAPYDPDDSGDDDEDSFESKFDDFEPPDDEEIADQNSLVLRRQRLFRWAAQAIAVALSECPDVEKVAGFGAVAQPLVEEVPRFREFRRHRIEVLHECADLDIAVWLNALDKLKDLKRAMQRGLALTNDTAYGGVAHHQVDVHIFDYASGDYRGRLCIFGQCPKPGKRECLVKDCGSKPFLRQFDNYRFRREEFEAAPKVLLFESGSGFLTPMPKIEGRK